jgi:streptomycin 6-kinase
MAKTQTQAQALSELTLKSVAMCEAMTTIAESAIAKALQVLEVAEALHAMVVRVGADPGATHLSAGVLADLTDWRAAPLSEIRPALSWIQNKFATQRAELATCISTVADAIE